MRKKSRGEGKSGDGSKGSRVIPSMAIFCCNFFFAFAGKVSDILFMEKLFRLKDLLLKFQFPTFVMSYRDGSNHSIQVAQYRDLALAASTGDM
jgi:hypothetical protein